MKIGDFAWYNRKISPYLASKELHSEFNRKTSAYFTIAGLNFRTRQHIGMWDYFKNEIKLNKVLTTVLAYKLTACE
jgi:hypothetical protein